MAIDVICPGCHKRFQVSDQYAGQKGPCPGCKTIIEIPKLEDVVVVHERETTASGTPAKLNSIRRQRTTVGKSELLCAFGALVAGLLFTVLARFGLTETHPHPGFLTTVLIGSLLGASHLAGSLASTTASTCIRKHDCTGRGVGALGLPAAVRPGRGK